VSSIIDILAKNYRARLELQRQLLAAEQQRRKLEKDAAGDPAAAVAAAREVGGLREEIRQASRLVRGEILAILTPEQKESLKAGRREGNFSRRGGWDGRAGLDPADNDSLDWEGDAELDQEDEED
jgi:Spy/CpxP family protein refolding chaperone